ncbi:MAG: hypothetical protein Q8Q00_11420 [Dehalococcoidia bacterium]|nr:hypothetical protein [Dehalococcoidia bacterium]
MMGHAQTASPSPDAGSDRRESDDAQRETVYRLMWLASLWVFPSEEQYARIFPDKPWRFSGAGRADRPAGEVARGMVGQAQPRSLKL